MATHVLRSSLSRLDTSGRLMLVAEFTIAHIHPRHSKYFEADNEPKSRHAAGLMKQLLLAKDESIASL